MNYQNIKDSNNQKIYNHIEKFKNNEDTYFSIKELIKNLNGKCESILENNFHIIEMEFKSAYEMGKFIKKKREFSRENTNNIKKKKIKKKIFHIKKDYEAVKRLEERKQHYYNLLCKENYKFKTDINENFLCENNYEKYKTSINDFIEIHDKNLYKDNYKDLSSENNYEEWKNYINNLMMIVFNISDNSLVNFTY